MSGKPDLFSKLPPAEPHWPEIRAWLQANPRTLLDDRSLLEEIGLKPHGRNVVEFGRAALTKLEEARIVATVAKSDAGPVFSMDGKTVPIAERLIQGPYNPSAKPWRVWPLVVGKRWEFEADWARPDGVTGSTQQKVEVDAYEEVTVPAGKFMAYKIVHRGFFRNSRGNSGQQDDTFWYAPDVKSDVKFERKSSRPVFVTELMSHKRSAP